MFKTLLLISTLLLSACGYHLRGSAELPKELNSIYLSGETASLREQFDKTLQLSAGQLLDTPSANSLSIHIVKEDMQRRVLSLSSRGRANEFELVYRLNYDLTNADNKAVLKNQPIEIRREYFNNQQDILAKDNEENVIRNEMYQQAVQTIINRARNVLVAKP
ncbi:MAG: LPS assembly lipoprotein LptE [Methylococcaceae bacterium]